MTTFEVRDMRIKEKFFVHDEYLNGYAKLCGSNATLVYLCLCRHADRQQESFPSVELMAEKLGISRASIMRGIKTLLDWNIISKERERGKGQKWLNNRYTLLDKSIWKSKPSIPQQHGEPSSKLEVSQVANQSKSQVAVSDTKDTHNTEGYTSKVSDVPSRDIVAVFEAFRAVNPSYGRWFANVTQRAAAGRMLKIHGLPRVTQVIAILARSNLVPYIPVITTPIQLEEKWAALEAGLMKKRNELQVKTAKVAF